MDSCVGLEWNYSEKKKFLKTCICFSLYSFSKATAKKLAFLVFHAKFCQ